MILLKLFWSFFQIGVLSFGGGYAALPLIEEELIHVQGWIDYQEFIDILTLSEMTPGPIAINAATFAGNQVSGIIGGIAATIGVIMPSLILVQLLAFFYFKYRDLSIVKGVIQGLRPAVVALIASAGLTLFLTAMFGHNDFPIHLGEINLISVVLFAIGIAIMSKYKASPIQIIVLTGILGGFIYAFI